MAKSNYGYMAKIGVDTTDLQEGLNKISTETKKIDTDIKQLDKSIAEGMKNGADVTEAQAAKMELLSQKYDNAKNKLDSLMSVYDEMKSAKDSGVINTDEWSKYINQIQQAQNALAECENAVNGVASANENVASSSATMGKDSSLGFGEVMKIANDTIGVVTSVASAISSVVDEITALATETAAVGDTIDKSSQRLGLSTEAYQKWEYVLSQNGADISTLGTAVNKLNNAYVDLESGTQAAADKFAKLGLSLEDVQGLTQEELFETVIKQLQSMDNEAERNAAANDLLGKSYMSLIPLLNQSAEGTEELLEKASEYGMVLDKDALSATVNYTDATDTLNRTLDGLKNTLVSGALPALTEFNNSLSEMVAEIASGDVSSESISASAMAMSDALVDEMNYVIFAINQIGTEIVPALCEGINSNIGNVAEKSAELVYTLAENITKNLPYIVQSAVEIVSGLASGIQNNLPLLIPEAVKAVQKISETLINNVSTVVDAAFKVSMGIAEGLINATPQILAEVPVLFVKLCDEILKAVPQVAVAFAAVCESMADSLVNFDWSAIASNMMENLITALSNAQRQVQVWLDNTFSGGALYGGDINNVAETEQIKWMRSGAEDIVKAVDECSKSVQEAYNAGKEEIGFSWQSYYDEMYGSGKEIKKADEAVADSVVDGSDALTSALDETTVLLVNSVGSAADNTTKATKEAKKTVSDAFSAFYSGIETALAHGDIAEAEYYKKLEEFLNSDVQYKDEIYNNYWTKVASFNKKQQETALKNAEAEATKKKKAYDDELKAKKKAAEDDKKQFEKEIAQWEKDAEKSIDEAKKSLEKAQEAINKKTDTYTTPTLTTQKDANGNDVLVLDDVRDKIRALEDYKSGMQKLIDAGMPQSLIDDIMAMSLDKRVEFVKALLASNYNLYFSDWRAYEKTANAVAAWEEEGNVKSATDAAKSKIDSIFEGIPEKSKEYGNEVASSFLAGLYDGLDKNSEIGKMMDVAINANNITSASSSVRGGKASGEVTYKLDDKELINNITKQNDSFLNKMSRVMNKLDNIGNATVTVNVDGEKYVQKSFNLQKTKDVVMDV